MRPTSREERESSSRGRFDMKIRPTRLPTAEWAKFPCGPREIEIAFRSTRPLHHGHALARHDGLHAPRQAPSPVFTDVTRSSPASSTRASARERRATLRRPVRIRSELRRRARRAHGRREQVADGRRAGGARSPRRRWRATASTVHCDLSDEAIVQQVTAPRARASSATGTPDQVRDALRARGVDVLDKERIWRSSDGFVGLLTSHLQDAEIAAFVELREQERSARNSTSPTGRAARQPGGRAPRRQERHVDGRRRPLRHAPARRRAAQPVRRARLVRAAESVRRAAESVRRAAALRAAAGRGTRACCAAARRRRRPSGARRHASRARDSGDRARARGGDRPRRRRRAALSLRCSARGIDLDEAAGVCAADGRQARYATARTTAGARDRLRSRPRRARAARRRAARRRRGGGGRRHRGFAAAARAGARAAQLCRRRPHPRPAALALHRS